jgi:hypothetical protein
MGFRPSPFYSVFYHWAEELSRVYRHGLEPFAMGHFKPSRVRSIQSFPEVAKWDNIMFIGWLEIIAFV